MAREETYQRQVAPRPAAPMPLASPEVFGSGVAEAIGQVGDTLHQKELREYQIERRLTADREAVEVGRRAALARQNIDTILTDMRNNPTSDDYGDHLERVGQLVEAQREGILDGITEDSVRNRAASWIDDFKTSAFEREHSFVEGQRTARMVRDFDVTTDVQANRVGRSDDPNAMRQELEAGYGMIEGLSADVETKGKMRDLLNQKIGVAWGNRLNDTNPQLAQALIDKGAFDELLSPEQIRTLRSGAQVEIRRQEAQAEHAKNVATAEYRDRLATAKVNSAAGIPQDEATLKGLMAGAMAAGDLSGQAEIRQMERENRYAQTYKGMPPLQRQSREAELGAIPADKRTEEQNTELHWLQTRGPSLTAQYNADKPGFVLTNGLPAEQPPPLVSEAPASFQARADWRRVAVRTYGTMDLLTGEEVKAYQDMATQSDAGYFQVAEELANFGGMDARDAARQVAPSDNQLQQLVLLSGNIRKIARDGQAWLKDNPKLLDPGDDAELKEAVTTRTAGFARALQGVPARDVVAIQEIARNIAAKFVHDAGAESMSEQLWSDALNLALGAVHRPDGWHGGIGSWAGHQFLVPEGKTANQFGRDVGTYIGQHPNDRPLNPDGSPANIGIARPVAVAKGVYQFFVGNRVLMTKGKDGKISKPWEYRVPVLP